MGCIKMPTGSWGFILQSCRSYGANRVFVGDMEPSLGLCLSNHAKGLLEQFRAL